MAGARIATYRLQLTEDFPFAAAAGQCAYLRALGVSHLYLSPILQARSGSRHGYDVVDPTRIDAERGGAEGFARLLASARAHGLGIVLDIVPNHMAASVENPWWRDLLAHGPRSRYAGTFDVDWQAGPIVLPILAEPLADLIASGRVRPERRDGAEVLDVAGTALPLAPGSLARVGTDVRALLAVQHWRLCRWQEAPHQVTYRRFFDISDLVGVRAEDPEAFAATHALVLDLVRRGDVDGLRVDHVDGLADPGGYLARLRAAAPDTPIWVEKILHAGERLHEAWPVQGTTGYEFARLADGLFVDPAGEAPLTELCAEVEARPFAAIAEEARGQALDALFPRELDRLARALSAHARARGVPADDDACRAAMRAFLVALPVYRTYLRPGEPPRAADRAVVEAAVATARESVPSVAELLACLRDALLASNGTAGGEELRRVQQFTPALAAKGVEDTALYRDVRLLALAEVGGDPTRFGVSPDEFHAAMAEVQRRWPQTLLATSTHDSKRSADVRARLCALSERPSAWAAAVRRFAAHFGTPGTTFPDRHVEFVCYQTAFGAWPIEVERVQAALGKAIREAKLRTSWLQPDAAYEEAVQRGVARVLGDPWFRAEMDRLVADFASAAHSNVLAGTLLHCTAPGIPDLYQGCELVALRLVDPDNRAPVDFAARARLLAAVHAESAAQVLARHDASAAKLWLIQRALAVRRARAGAFGHDGAYEPLLARGVRHDRIVAFVRGGDVVVAVPRLTANLGSDFGATALPLPPGRWRDELTGARCAGEVGAHDLFAGFPVALLVREGGGS